MADTTGPSEDQLLLTESLDVLVPVADELTIAFYDRLFAEHPRLRVMFPPVFDPGRERLVHAMLALATRYDNAGDLVPGFVAMARRHERYGIRIEDYATVGAVLIRTLRDFSGTAWTPAHQGAWVRAYTFAAATMMRAGALADEEEPQLAA
jgi:methyl-accepting chemotaxis protein